jgi:hypothetical protein
MRLAATRPTGVGRKTNTRTGTFTKGGSIWNIPWRAGVIGWAKGFLQGTWTQFVSDQDCLDESRLLGSRRT